MLLVSYLAERRWLRSSRLFYLHGSDKSTTFAGVYNLLSWYYIFEYPEHPPGRVGVFCVLCINHLAKKMLFLKIFAEKFCRFAEMLYLCNVLMMTQ